VDLLQQHLSINGLEVFATNDATWATSVLIHRADKTSSATADAAQQCEPNTSANKIIVSNVRAVGPIPWTTRQTDITPTPVVPLPIQFQATPLACLWARCVSYDDSRISPMLPSGQVARGAPERFIRESDQLSRTWWMTPTNPGCRSP
jgi:hypothetical protein